MSKRWPSHPGPEFQPSPAQRRFVEFVVAHPEFKTVTQFCEAAEVPRSNYERWAREPNFRAWFIREWCSALLFEGWHILNLARANMVNSPVHFQSLFNLIFSPNGQAALAGWAERGARAPEDIWQSPEAPTTVVETRLLPSAPPVAPVAAPQGDFPSCQPQNKPLSQENGKNPPTPSDITRTLRNAILGIREADR